MAYTAWVPGNHDLDLPADSLIPAIQRGATPVVAANLAATGWSPPGHLVAGGGRIAIVGLTRSGRDPGWVVTDPAAGLRKRVDTLVLLGHSGASEKRGLRARRERPRHQELPVPLWIGGTPVVQVGANGRHVGFIRGVPGDWRHQLLAAANFPPDLALARDLRQALLRRHPFLGEVLAHRPSPTAGRHADAKWPLADWAADAVGADAAPVSWAAVEPHWAAGPVTCGDRCNLYHHDEDPLVVARFDRPALVRAVEELANARLLRYPPGGDRRCASARGATRHRVSRRGDGRRDRGGDDAPPGSSCAAAVARGDRHHGAGRPGCGGPGSGTGPSHPPTGGSS